LRTNAATESYDGTNELTINPARSCASRLKEFDRSPDPV
jgi:hypothetical protein